MITLIRLTLEGFKRFSERTIFEFQPGENKIVGANNTGKTTIPEAINYCVTGRDLAGSVTVDHLINDGSRKMEVDIDFEKDGIVHKMIRSRQITDKGATVNKVYIDSKEVTQDQIVAFFGDPTIFMAIFIPTFIHAMDSDKAAALLKQFIKPVDEAVILAALLSSHQEALKGEKLHDPAALASTKRAEIKKNDTEITKLEGEVKVHNKTIEQPIPDLKQDLEFEIVATNEEVKEARARVKAPIDTSILRASYNRLSDEYKRLTAAIKLLPQAPEPSRCHYCGQDVTTQEAVATMETNYKKEVAKITTENQATKQRVAQVVTEANQALAQFKLAEAANAAIDTSAANNLVELENKLQRYIDQNTTIKIENGQRDLLVKQVEQAKREKDQALKRITTLKDLKPKLEEKITALGEYAEKREEKELQQLTRLLDGRITIKLHSIVKSTGEMKPDFKLLFDGQPFRVMSNSNRSRCGIGISNMINTLTGAGYPVYIDNFEAISDVDFELPTGQYFTATVVDVDRDGNPMPLMINPTEEFTATLAALKQINEEEVLGLNMFDGLAETATKIMELTQGPIDNVSDVKVNGLPIETFQPSPATDAIVETVRNLEAAAAKVETRWPAGPAGAKGEVAEDLIKRHSQRTGQPDGTSTDGHFCLVEGEGVRPMKADQVEELPIFPTDEFPAFPIGSEDMPEFPGLDDALARGHHGLDDIAAPPASISEQVDDIGEKPEEPTQKKNRYPTPEEARDALARFDGVKEKHADNLREHLEGEKVQMVATAAPANFTGPERPKNGEGVALGQKSGESLLDYHKRMTSWIR